MGIWDRDYARNEGPSLLASWANSGLVCKWLVGVNVGLFLIQLLTARQGGLDLGWFSNALAMQPERVFQHFELWRLLTGAFLHDPTTPWHIFWNMLFLWFFGKAVEDHYGHREFLTFYLVAGFVGNLFWGLMTIWGVFQPPLIGLNGLPMYPMALGASGAVTACMVLCAFHYPHRTILLMFVIPVPYWLFALVHVGGDLFYFLRGTSMGVAVAAHLGGAGFAALYYVTEFRFTSFFSDFLRRASRSRRPRLTLYRGEEESPVAAGNRPPTLDEHLEAKTDEVLAKLSRQGMESLTPEERDILRKASEEYRKRRQ